MATAKTTKPKTTKPKAEPVEVVADDARDCLGIVTLDRIGQGVFYTTFTRQGRDVAAARGRRARGRAAGELVVRGPQVMFGYHNMPTETANTLRKDPNDPDGAPWLYTGDIARIDVDTYFMAATMAQQRVASAFGTRFSIPYAVASLIVRGGHDPVADASAAAAHVAALLEQA